VHRDVADFCLGDNKVKCCAQLRCNHARCRELLRAAQLIERPRIHHNRIVLLHSPHSEREMNDQPNACGIRYIPPLRLCGNDIVNHPYLCPVDETEQRPIRR